MARARTQTLGVARSTKVRRLCQAGIGLVTRTRMAFGEFGRSNGGGGEV
jgi:hypothetical protein